MSLSLFKNPWILSRFWEGYWMLKFAGGNIDKLITVMLSKVPREYGPV